jgi:hypothetical protein
VVALLKGIPPRHLIKKKYANRLTSGSASLGILKAVICKKGGDERGKRPIE